MKRSLMVFAAISAFALPALAPVATLAQDRGGDRGTEDRARAPNRGNNQGPRQRTEPSAAAQSDRGPGNRGDRGDRPAQDRGGDRGDRGGSRPDRPETSQPTPRPDQGRDDSNRPGQNRPGADGSNQGRPTQARPDQGRPDQGGARPDRPDQGRPGQDRPGQNRPGSGNGGWNGNNGGWNGGNAGRPGDNRPGDNRPGAGSRPDRPGSNWNNGGNRDRDRQRNEFRNRFDSSRWQQNWNRNNRSDWWRSDRRFSGWTGSRIGFYFAPGYGYYSVPRTYYGRQYYVGDFLPSIFWRYSINDYRTYGLGYPPEGTRWVYVDNTIYLIDQYDGYVIDVIRNAWRW